jgi:hypothetical protein
VTDFLLLLLFIFTESHYIYPTSLTLIIKNEVPMCISHSDTSTKKKKRIVLSSFIKIVKYTFKVRLNFVPWRMYKSLCSFPNIQLC